MPRAKPMRPAPECNPEEYAAACRKHPTMLGAGAKLLIARLDQVEAELTSALVREYQLCGLVCDELKIAAKSARATAASRRPNLSAGAI